MDVTTRSTSPLRTPSRSAASAGVDDIVRHRIKTCPYSFVFNKITWQFADGTLTLRGSVSSFYLKQVLQELLLNIDRVDCIQNEAAVVCSTGLSSDGPDKPR